MNYNVDDTFQVDKISSIPVETLIQIIEIVSVDTFERLNGDKAPSEGCQKVLSAQRMVSIRQFVGLRTVNRKFQQSIDSSHHARKMVAYSQSRQMSELEQAALNPLPFPSLYQIDIPGNVFANPIFHEGTLARVRMLSNTAGYDRAQQYSLRPGQIAFFLSSFQVLLPRIKECLKEQTDSKSSDTVTCAQAIYAGRGPDAEGLIVGYPMNLPFFWMFAKDNPVQLQTAFDRYRPAGGVNGIVWWTGTIRSSWIPDKLPECTAKDNVWTEWCRSGSPSFFSLLPTSFGGYNWFLSPEMGRAWTETGREINFQKEAGADNGLKYMQKNWYGKK